MRFNKDNAPEEIVFNGVVFRRMGGKRRYWLSQSKSTAGRRNAKGLHVAIWEHHNGRPVQPGHDVHHRDSDVFNFEPDNLECLQKGSHRSMAKVNVDREAMLANLARQRPKASEWHKSEVGRDWHRRITSKGLEKAREVLAAKPRGDARPIIGIRHCEWCGNEFPFRSKRNRICSPVCQLEKSAFKRGKRRKGPSRASVQPNG